MKKTWLILFSVLFFSGSAFATVSSSTSRIQHNCNGATTAFTFTFGASDTDEISVVHADSSGTETELTETTNYTVSCTNDDCSTGGTVTTVATYATGDTITIIRDIPITQDADFTENMPTLYETFETALDKSTRIQQQFSEQLQRTPSIARSSEYAGTEYTFPDPNGGRIIGWNSGGSDLTTFEVSNGDTIDVAATVKILSDYADFATALSTIGVTECELWIDEDVALTANTATPKTLKIKVLPGSRFTGAFTLTINGQFEGAEACFGPTVTVAGLGYAIPEYWGQNATPGTTDMTAEIQDAIDAVGSGGIVFFKPEEYLFSNITIYQSCISLVGSGICARAELKAGTGYSGTVLVSSSTATAPIILSDGAVTKFHKVFRDMAISATTDADIPIIDSVESNRTVYERVFIFNRGLGDGVHLEHAFLQSFYDCFIEKEDTGEVGTNVRTGKGVLITNPAHTAGLYNFYTTTLFQWSYGIFAGEDSATPTGYIASVNFIGSQVKSNTYGIHLTGGVKGANISGSYLEGSVGASIRVVYKAAAINIENNYFSDPGAAVAGSIVLGMGGGDDEKKMFYGVVINNNLFNAVDTYGIVSTPSTTLVEGDAIVTNNRFYGKVTVPPDVAGVKTAIKETVKQILKCDNNSFDSEILVDWSTTFPEMNINETYSMRTTIDTTDVLTLNFAPVTVVPSPGTNKYIQFVSAHVWYDYGTAAYADIAAGDDLEFHYTDASGQELASIEATGFLDQVADEHRQVYARADTLATPTTLGVTPNAAVVLYMSGSEITTGDGDLYVEVIYRILDRTW